MVPTVDVSISIQETLFEQAKILAQHLNISQNQLFESAVEHFIRSHEHPTRRDERYTNPPKSPSQDAQTAMPMGGGRTVINQPIVNQGDIYWVQLENPSELEPSIPHPYVVIQENVLNYSRINTIVACALTSNRGRISDAPGNLLLEVGEANLPKQSVVEVSKVSTIEKSQLGEYIGSLTEQRVNQIVAGMRFLQLTFFAR